jgi:hypothetical protein
MHNIAFRGNLPQQLTMQLVFMGPNGVTTPVTCCDPKPFFPVKMLVTEQFSNTYKTAQSRSTMCYTNTRSSFHGRSLLKNHFMMANLG